MDGSLVIIIKEETKSPRSKRGGKIPSGLFSKRSAEERRKARLWEGQNKGSVNLQVEGLETFWEGFTE